MFKPNMDAIKRWVSEGQLSSDLSSAERSALMESEAGKAACKAMKSAFSGPDGEAALLYLAEASVLRAPVDHRMAGAEYVAYAQLRQGQNQLFALICELIETAKEIEYDRSERPTSDTNVSFDGSPFRGDAGSYANTSLDSGWTGFDDTGDVAIT